MSPSRTSRLVHESKRYYSSTLNRTLHVSVTCSYGHLLPNANPMHLQGTSFPYRARALRPLDSSKPCQSSFTSDVLKEICRIKQADSGRRYMFHSWTSRSVLINIFMPFPLASPAQDLLRQPHTRFRLTLGNILLHINPAENRVLKDFKTQHAIF
jgi:hypothetical protein